MDDKLNKVIIITLVTCGIIFTIIGATFAYFSARITSNQNDIKGSTYKFDVKLNIDTIKNDKLIPVSDSLIDDTLNSTHICTDQRGYGLCYLYKLTLNNSGAPQTMTGNIKTTNTTYTTNNLKYQLFTLSGSTYTAASDMKSVPAVNTTSDFTLNSSNISVNLTEGTTTPYTTDYYLVLWLSDPGTNQLEDSNKSYSGTVSFVSTNGNIISVDFSN